MPVGYPGDSDPRDEEPEWQCVKCQGVVVAKAKYAAECLDCGETYEADCDIENSP